MHNSTWLPVTKSLGKFPWYVESFVARHAKTASDARQQLEHLGFLFNWLCKAGPFKGRAREEIDLFEIARLPSAEMAKYQAALFAAPRYRDKQEAVRNLKLLRDLLSLASEWLGTKVPSLLDLRASNGVGQVMISVPQPPLVIVTCARPEEDLFPALSDRQIVVSPFASDGTLECQLGVWDITSLCERLPAGYESATLLVQVDADLAHRPTNLAGWPGRRLLCDITPSLTRLGDAPLLTYLEAEPFDGIVSALPSAPVRRLSRLPVISVPGLLCRYVSNAATAMPRNEVVVLAPLSMATASGDTERPSLAPAARLADRLMAVGVSAAIFEGSPAACLRRAADSLLAVWPGADAAPLALLAAGVIPATDASIDLLAGAPWRPELTHLPYHGDLGLDPAVPSAVARIAKTGVELRRGLEVWQRQARLSATREQLWSGIAALDTSSPADESFSLSVAAQLPATTARAVPLGSDAADDRLDPSWLDVAPNSDGITLKLYIDSTSLSVIHQMADFVRCEFDPSVVKVITWRRCELAESELAASQTIYFRQANIVSAQLVELVANLVTQMKPQHIELHSNLRWTFEGVFPVLHHLFNRGLTRPQDISLVLYDDGIWSLMERDAMLRHPGFGADLELAALGLIRRLFDGDKTPATRWMGYAWHRVLRTQYVGMQLGRLFDHVAPHPVVTQFGRAHKTMDFAHRRDLSDAQWNRYLHFFGLTAPLQEQLRSLCAASEAFLYLGTGVTQPGENRRYADLQIATIQRLRERGVFPTGVPFAFKGHPANPTLEREVMRALGDDVIHIPARMPLEVLQMAGLIPPSVCGVLSTSYLNLDPQAVKFIFGHPLGIDPNTLEEIVQLLVECGVIDRSRIFPWME